MQPVSAPRRLTPALLALADGVRERRGAAELVLLGICGAAVILNPSVGVLLIAGALAWLWETRAPALPRFAGPTLFLAVVAAYVVTVVARTPFAPDDLLRDIAVGRYGFDYRQMFPLSAGNLLPVSMWWGFDHALWEVSQVLGGLRTVWLVQGLLATAYVLWLVGVALRILPAEQRWWWASLVLSLVAPLVLPRILLGRPEIFLTVWCAYAVLVRGRFSLIAWVSTGFALSLSYWLAPLYFVGAALLSFSARARIAIAASLLLFHCTAWFFLTNGAYVEALLWLTDVLASQAAPVAENISLSTLVRVLPFTGLLLAAAFAVAGRPRQAIIPFAVAVFFAASDQVRYVASVATFLGLTAITGFADRLPVLSNAVRAGLLVALPLMGLHFAGTSYRLSEVPSFRMPTGSLTLTAFGAATFSVPFFGEGTPGVEPSFAFGAAPRAVQQLSIGLSQGRLDCNALGALPFTHVLESTLNEIPVCLVLAGVDGNWRLWRVRGRQ